MTLLFFLGCSSESRISFANNELDINLNTVEIVSNYDGYLDKIDYIKLEDHPDAHISVVDKVIISSEHILVGSLQQSAVIYIFDRAGNYLNKIYSSGTGIGKYLELSDVYIDDNNGLVILGDNGSKKMLLFDLDGNFLAEKSIGFHFSNFSQIIDPNGVISYVFYIPQPISGSNEISNESIVFTDNNFKVTGSFFQKSETQQNLNYNSRYRLFSSSAGTYFNPPISGEIHEINSINESRLIYNIENGVENIETKVKEVLKKGMSVEIASELNSLLPVFTYVVNESHIACATWIKNIPYQLVIDRSSSNIVLLPMIIDAETIQNVPLAPITTFQKYFVTLKRPDYFTRLNTINETGIIPKFEGSNPVLVFQSMKSF